MFTIPQISLTFPTTWFGAQSGWEKAFQGASFDKVATWSGAGAQVSVEKVSAWSGGGITMETAFQRVLTKLPTWSDVTLGIEKARQSVPFDKLSTLEGVDSGLSVQKVYQEVSQFGTSTRRYI